MPQRFLLSCLFSCITTIYFLRNLKQILLHIAYKQISYCEQNDGGATRIVEGTTISKKKIIYIKNYNISKKVVLYIKNKLLVKILYVTVPPTKETVQYF